MQQALHVLTSPQTGVKCSEQLTDRIKDNTFLSCGWRKHRPALTSQPHPSVDEPESDGDGVQDHLSLCSLFVLFLQMLESPVQLDELPSKCCCIDHSHVISCPIQRGFICWQCKPGIMQGVGAGSRPPSQWWFAKGWGKTELGKGERDIEKPTMLHPCTQLGCL